MRDEGKIEVFLGQPMSLQSGDREQGGIDIACVEQADPIDRNNIAEIDDLCFSGRAFTSSSWTFWGRAYPRDG